MRRRIERKEGEEEGREVVTKEQGGGEVEKRKEGER